MENVTKDCVVVMIDRATYKKFSSIAERKGKSAVDEISNALESHMRFEDEKFHQIHEGRKYLTEDK